MADAANGVNGGGPIGGESVQPRFARESAVSLPSMLLCVGTQCRVTVVDAPRVLSALIVSLAVCELVMEW